MKVLREETMLISVLFSIMARGKVQLIWHLLQRRVGWGKVLECRALCFCVHPMAGLLGDQVSFCQICACEVCTTCLRVSNLILLGEKCYLDWICLKIGHLFIATIVTFCYAVKLASLWKVRPQINLNYQYFVNNHYLNVF